MYYYPTVPKEKVTLTLDAETLEELRSLVGARSLSAAVNASIGAHVARLRHLQAVDDWLAELEREHGPIPVEAREWAARQVDRWESSRGGRRRRAS
jgi:hypothetical protein